MSHGPAIDLSHDQPPLPNQHFSSWLRGQTTLFISQIVAVIGSISLLASTIYYVLSLGKSKEPLTLLTVKLIVEYAHLAFIAVFILVLIRFLDDNERGNYRVKLVYERVFKGPKAGEKEIGQILREVKARLREFKRRFLWFWIGMLCLYVSFAGQHTYEASLKKASEPAARAISLDFSGESLGKEEKFKGGLSVSINDKAPDPPGGKKLSWEKAFMQLAFPFLDFLFNNLTLMFVFWCFLVMYIKPDEIETKESKYMAGSAGVVLFLTVLFPLFPYLTYLTEGEFESGKLTAYTSVFNALSGVVNAVVLALLVARLDSKLVGLPSWLISILYSYAAVQPLFLVFELTKSDLLNTIATLVLIFVFISKIYFFLIIFYALQTGKMLNYLACFPILRKRAGEPAGSADERSSALRRLATYCISVMPRSALGWLARYGILIPPPWSALRRLVRYGNLVPYLFVRRRRRTRQKRADAPARSLRSHMTEMSARLGMIASRALRSRRSLDVSELLGVFTILYFFIFMIASQVSPGAAPLVVLQGHDFGVNIGVAQLIFVLMMIATLLLVLGDNGNGCERVAATAEAIFVEPLNRAELISEGIKQLEKFKRYFLYFWCVTLLLYLVFLSHLRDQPPEVCVPAASKTIGCMVKLLFYPTLEFVLSSLNLMCAFWCFVVLQSPSFVKPADVRSEHSATLRDHFGEKRKRFEARQKLLVNYSSFVILLLIAAFPLLLLWRGGPKLTEAELRDYATVFNGVTGMLSAIVLALLIARMDSKLFSLPSRLIWMLFAYASIQTLFIAFAQNDPVLKVVRTWVLHSALGLKICFFLVVAHSLQTGKMLNYFVCFPLLKERVDSIFENQFEIRLARAEHHKFTFSILKKNQLYYSAARSYDSREECDKAVEELRELMKSSESYGKPGRSSGTYWVKVRSPKDPPREGISPETESGDGLLCESIPLRSKEEALDLIDESMGKVPYCKYNRL